MSHSETQNNAEKGELSFLFVTKKLRITPRKKNPISYSVIEKTRITQRKKSPISYSVIEKPIITQRKKKKRH